MVDIKLNRPGKGTPPPPEQVTHNNLAKPASHQKVHQQVKISAETRRAFRARAAEMDIDLGTLFELMWQSYKAHNG
jgi:hypothetical protein